MPSNTDLSDVAGTHSDHLRELIRAEIVAAGGALPFDRFMELALYAPGLGYYVAGAAKLGADGDFVTAPDLSPLFGRCVATQCEEVLRALDGGDVLEFGAGSGALAAELLATLADMGALPDRYLILEPSPDLADRQRGLLAERTPPELFRRLSWITTPPAELRGVVIANEVLDAMPVHRFCIAPDAGRTGPDPRIGAGIDAGRVREVLVETSTDGFREVQAAPISAGLASAVKDLKLDAALTEDGFCSELNLRLRPWISMLAERLQAGMLLIIDYGYPRREYYRPERRDGTLMCYHRHQAHADLYANLGLQDITAHVDFTAVAEAGLEAGFELSGYTTQANFLLGCGLDQQLARAGTTPEDMLSIAAGAKQLVLPSAMGERFQALALSRGIEAPAAGWCGFSRRDLRARLGCRR